MKDVKNMKFEFPDQYSFHQKTKWAQNGKEDSSQPILKCTTECFLYNLPDFGRSYFLYFKKLGKKPCLKAGVTQIVSSLSTTNKGWLFASAQRRRIQLDSLQFLQRIEGPWDRLLDHLTSVIPKLAEGTQFVAEKINKEKNVICYMIVYIDLEIIFCEL